MDSIPQIGSAPIESEFRLAITAAGLIPPKFLVADGNIHRFSSDGRPSDSAGWYVLHADESPWGAFGCWRQGIDRHWTLRDERHLTELERQTVIARRRAHEREQERQHQEAREKAQAIWEKAVPITSHKYLERKGVQAYGIRMYEGRIVIPVKKGKVLHSLQFIGGDGDKEFLKGGQIGGHYFVIGDVKETICITEGYATGATIYEQTGHTVVVAFNAGNMEVVAQYVHSQLPDRKFIICADDDHQKPENTGFKKAEQAARAIGAKIAVPRVAKSSRQEVTDFNDLMSVFGSSAVKDAVDGALTIVDFAKLESKGAEQSKDRKNSGVQRGAFIIRPGGRKEALARADEILGVQENVFQRNGDLVLVATVAGNSNSEKSLVHRDPDSLVIVPMTADHVMNSLASEKWAKIDSRSGSTKPIDFPRELAAGVVCDTERIHVRPLTGIIGAPTLDLEMNVISTPGYHKSTGLLLATAETFRSVPKNPTREDALVALQKLREPYSEFPWASSASDSDCGTVAESVHLAAIFTAAGRHLVDTAPAFAYDAPRRGSGKTMLADSIGIIFQGIPPAHANYATGDDEFRKLIASLLIAGDRIVLIDNVDRPLRSPELCNALTATRYTDRKLGHSERLILDSRIVWLFTGNNLQFVGDMARRVLVARIDAEDERPETRQFKIPNLLEHIAKQRVDMVPAVLTILLAFMRENPTMNTKPFGSFGNWSRRFREPLIWLDMPDPVAAIDEVNDTEPETQARSAVLAALAEIYRGRSFTVLQIVERARNERADRSVFGSENSPLVTALENALGGHREINAKSIGIYLRGSKAIIADGKRVCMVGKGHSGYALWKVEVRDASGQWC
ncbi:MAG TPA: toprim domain-containing protein [Burkholderiales bacterium]|nr:toprim domain-containing protein [Burkholderiales bacterium]